MKKPYLEYCKYSQTIRQMPQNYLVAYKRENFSYWICDPDGAADKDILVKVFLSILEHENRYCKDGEQLAKVLNEKIQK